MFRPNPPRSEGGLPTAVIAVAVAIVLVILGGLLILGRRHRVDPNQPQPAAAYAGNLVLSQLAMSESTSLSGGKSTFLDGQVTNKGPQVVTGVTVQVFFKNEEGMPPHLETVPLSLIRTREPYIDTQPVAASPLKPGETRAFRLIFESIPTNWNTQLPEVRATHIETR